MATVKQQWIDLHDEGETLILHCYTNDGNTCQRIEMTVERAEQLQRDLAEALDAMRREAWWRKQDEAEAARLAAVERNRQAHEVEGDAG